MTHRAKIQARRDLPLVLSETPHEYDQHFMTEIVHFLNIWAQGIRNPGPLRATYLFCDDRFPRNGNHLEEGAVFIDGTTLGVVLPNRGYPPSFVATMGLGSVTVSIS